MSRRFLPIVGFVVVVTVAGVTRADTATNDSRQILHAMASAVAEVRDYTMTLVSQEWNGDGMGPAEMLVTKWARPFKVYFKRLSAPHIGREILYAEGWNDGKLKVSVHAWPITIGVNVNPHGDLAMAEAKHPVDESSLIYLVNVVLENFRRAEERGEGQAEDHGRETILGHDCHRLRIFTTQSVTTYRMVRGETLWDVERKFGTGMAPLLHENRELRWLTPSDAKPGQTIHVPRYYAARIDLWIDETLMLPLRAEIFDARGVMFERFEHHDLRVNVGLGPQDFSPRNPAYKF